MLTVYRDEMNLGIHKLDHFISNQLTIHIYFCQQIALFQQQPQLRQYVRPAIDRAVQELIHPVVERSIKICLTTAEMIVKKVRMIKIKIRIKSIRLRLQ